MAFMGTTSPPNITVSCGGRGGRDGGGGGSRRGGGDGGGGTTNVAVAFAFGGSDFSGSVAVSSTAIGVSIGGAFKRDVMMVTKHFVFAFAGGLGPLDSFADLSPASWKGLVPPESREPFPRLPPSIESMLASSLGSGSSIGGRRKRALSNQSTRALEGAPLAAAAPQTEAAASANGPTGMRQA